MRTEQTHGPGNLRCGKCNKLLAKGHMSRVWLRHIKQQEFYPAKASRWRSVGGFKC